MFRYARALALRSHTRRSINTIRTKKPIEEETLTWYKPDYFYPVKVGQVFKSRYKVLGKLGHGAYSTTWLCRDLQHERKHVALKASTINAISADSKRESEIFRHINSMKSKHVGRSLIRTSIDEFEIKNERGTYKFLVQPPMSLELLKFQSRFPGKRLPVELLKSVVHHVLLALDFLHTEAKVIHTDIQVNNILLGIDDSDGSFEEYATKERSDPSPHKVSDDEHVVYTSRNLHPNSYGRPVLCDFGEARFIREEGYSEDIQPVQYRAPEVILGIPWNENVDIWSVGVMIWDMFEAKHLFPLSSDSTDKNVEHLARMVALLSPPPLDFLRRSKTDIPWQYFTEEGEWKGRTQIPDDTLETSEENLRGEDKAAFLRFVRRMLVWKPEERASARELLGDSWLITTTRLT